jgi:NAD(P)H-hydrate epimerase
MKLVTVAEMQAIEREADAAGLTYEQMMENAGSGLADIVANDYAHLKKEGVLGLVGSGNNGGDALVALAKLARQGWMANAYLVRPRPPDDPLIARLNEAGGRIYAASEDTGLTQLEALLNQHGVLFDGVLGTGIRLPLKPEVAGVLESARKTLGRLEIRPVVVAVDCPSGVDSDSGETAAETIPADLTVTMAAIKRGLLKFPAFQKVGALKVVSIGIVEGDFELKTWESVRRVVPSLERISQSLPLRPLDAHKGTFGTALVIAGSTNYTGAALLAGEAAYRIGAGLVTLAIPSPLHASLAGHFPEATWLLLPHEIGVIHANAADVIRENLKKATAILIGPGFGTEDTTGEFLARLLASSARTGRAGMGFVRSSREPSKPGSDPLPPLVIDADGLKLLARIPEWFKQISTPAVLTPHPGEMSILTGLSKDEIQANRLEIAEKFSREWGHVVILKGAFTVVASPDGQAAVIPVATPALARAGTGDILAGLVVGLRAQGVEAFPAAMAAAWIHAQAGLQAAEALGNTASVLAGDVLAAVVDVISELYEVMD